MDEGCVMRKMQARLHTPVVAAVRVCRFLPKKQKQPAHSLTAPFHLAALNCIE
jgi:hypothetical protein